MKINELKNEIKKILNEKSNVDLKRIFKELDDSKKFWEKRKALWKNSNEKRADLFISRIEDITKNKFPALVIDIVIGWIFYGEKYTEKDIVEAEEELTNYYFKKDRKDIYWSLNAINNVIKNEMKKEQEYIDYWDKYFKNKKGEK